uniref:Uncharacterized protein n=1 Tax=Arundo donax TaxID=35708 RepID=A0A0A9DMD5_ARUDO
MRSIYYMITENLFWRALLLEHFGRSRQPRNIFVWLGSLRLYQTMKMLRYSYVFVLIQAFFILTTAADLALLLNNTLGYL